jgi:glycosyltransferase involved in cell wall biosynthesis
MNEPLVSVCIGAYNRKDYIRECVDSALGQTWPNKEIVVVDDASTDGTREILKSYGDAIRLILRDANSGICPITRNQAARAARGAYVAFLDSDDVWYPDKLAKQVAFMEVHPEVPLCHTLCNVIDERSRVVGVRHGAGVVPPTGMIFERLLDHCWVTISTVMVRRELFDDVGGFNEETESGIIGEDLDYFLRVARKYSIGLVNEVLAGYRKAPAGISRKRWRAIPESQSFNEILIRRRHVWEGVVPKSRVVRAHSEACIANARHWRSCGYVGRPLYFCWRGLLHDLGNLQLWEETGRTLFRALLPRRRQNVETAT